MKKIHKTSVERHFRRMPSGLYREFFLFFIHEVDEFEYVLNSQLDRITIGKLYKKTFDLTDKAFFGDDIPCKFPEDNYKEGKLIPLINPMELSHKKMIFNRSLI